MFFPLSLLSAIALGSAQEVSAPETDAHKLRALEAIAALDQPCKYQVTVENGEVAPGSSEFEELSKLFDLELERVEIEDVSKLIDRAIASDKARRPGSLGLTIAFSFVHGSDRDLQHGMEYSGLPAQLHTPTVHVTYEGQGGHLEFQAPVPNAVVYGPSQLFAPLPLRESAKMYASVPTWTWSQSAGAGPALARVQEFSGQGRKLEFAFASRDVNLPRAARWTRTGPSGGELSLFAFDERNGTPVPVKSLQLSRNGTQFRVSRYRISNYTAGVEALDLRLPVGKVRAIIDATGAKQARIESLETLSADWRALLRP